MINPPSIPAPRGSTPGPLPASALAPYPQAAHVLAPEMATTSSIGPIQFVLFEIGTLTLALPITTVSQVVKLGTVEGTGQSAWGVMSVDDQPYTVLDLHQHLFKRPLNPDQAPAYVVLTALATGELMGIPVVTTPTLVEVMGDRVRLLPASYRQADTLALASHIARWTTEKGEEQSFFVLDMNSLVTLQALG